MIKNFEIFPSLHEIKDSLLKAFEQHLKKNLVRPDSLDFISNEDSYKLQASSKKMQNYYQRIWQAFLSAGLKEYSENTFLTCEILENL